MKPSGILNFENVPADAGDPDVKVYVNGSEVEIGGGSSVEGITPITVKFNVVGDPADSQRILFNGEDEDDGFITGLIKTLDDQYYPGFQGNLVNGGSSEEYNNIVKVLDRPMIAKLTNGAEPVSVTGDCVVKQDGGLYYMEITGNCEITAQAV